jgi:hypothetical protein
MLEVLGAQLIERLRTKYTDESNVSGHNFRVPMPSASPYLNPHISAES